MARKLRGRQPPDEPYAIITVRIPQSAHKALSDEAHKFKTSLNRLCVSKLTQHIEEHQVILPSQNMVTECNNRKGPHQRSGYGA